MLHIIAAIAAGILFLIGQLIYLQSLRRLLNDPVDPLRPRIVSWIIWLSLDTLTFWGMLKDPNTSVFDLGQILGAILGGYIIFAVMIPHIEKNRPKSYEYGCLVLAAGSVLSSGLMREQYLTVGLAQLGAFVGSIPTFVSVRENPKNEPLIPWVIYLASAPLQIVAVEHWSLPTLMQITCFIVVQSIIVYYVAVKPRIIPRRPQPDLSPITVAERYGLTEGTNEAE